MFIILFTLKKRKNAPFGYLVSFLSKISSTNLKKFQKLFDIVGVLCKLYFRISSLEVCTCCSAKGWVSTVELRFVVVP